MNVVESSKNKITENMIKKTPVTDKNLEHRQIKIEKIDAGVYLYSMGKTTCIGTIKHVISQHPRSKTSPCAATLISRYIMVPGSCTPRATRQYSKGRTIEINNLIKSSFSCVLPLHLYPSTQIYLLADLVSVDGGSRTCAINCLSYCLSKTKLPYVGKPIAVAFGLNAADELVVDLNYEEDSTGHADCPVVFNMPTKKLLNLQMEGKMTREQFLKGFDAALEAAKKIYTHQEKLDI